MKCEDVRPHLEPMLNGELAPGQMEEMQLHLSRCAACSREYRELKEKTALLKKVRAGTRAPGYLEDRIRQRFTQRYRRPIPKYKIAAVWLMALVLVSTAYAQAKTGFLSELMGFDRGVEHALLQGAGQIVNEQVTIDGVSVNLHSMVIDPNRSVVLYTVEGAPAEADLVSISSTISPNGGQWTNKWSALNNGVVTGQLETSGRGLQEHVRVEFNEIHFIRTHTVTVPLDVNGDYPQAIPLENGDEFILEGIDLTSDSMRINVSPNNLTHPYIAPSSLNYGLLVNLYKDGEPLGAGWEVGHYSSQWPLDLLGGLNGDFSISLSYFEILTELTSPIVFEVEVDSNKAKQHTVITELNKRIELDPGVVLQFDRITTTASQSVIEFRLEAENGKQYYPDILLRTGGKVVNSAVMDWKMNNKQERVYSLKFDPTTTLDQLELEIRGYELWNQSSSEVKEYISTNITIQIP